VLEHDRGARVERPDDLPVGEVPRHDREHDPERNVGHEGVDRLGLDRLRPHQRRTVLGEPVARPRALVDRRDCRPAAWPSRVWPSPPTPRCGRAAGRAGRRVDRRNRHAASLRTAGTGASSAVRRAASF
jgi:hypothetical protein